MKPNELRMGNLFSEEKSKNIIEVIGLEKNRIVFSGMFLEKWQAKPILITEEWLLMFGFKRKHKYSFVLNKYICEFFLQDMPVSFRISINPAESIFVKHIRYVHELQNLYFYLTEEDLIFKDITHN